MVYLCAVAKFKLGRYLACREQLAELLKVRLGYEVTNIAPVPVVEIYAPVVIQRRGQTLYPV